MRFTTVLALLALWGCDKDDDPKTLDSGGDGGTDTADDFPLEPNGVAGTVADRAGDTLTTGTVYFVPADAVAALPATTVAVGSPDDEPLEDTIAALGSTMPQATVGADGRYALSELPDGRYFVVFVPDAADTAHLPGGTLCRVAVDAAAVKGTRQDVVVSSVAPVDATYVGSGRCVGCHADTEVADTMHRNGIWSPYVAGPLQDLAARPELWAPLSDKFAAGTTVYFSGYDETRGFDKYKTSEADPGAGVSFTVTLVGSTEAGYDMVLHNVANADDPDVTIRVDAVYGGGVKKQRYLTKVTNASGTYYAPMPLQYQEDGAESAEYGRTSKVWRDYHGDWWYDEATQTFETPGASSSFEKNCISCHAAGAQVTGSDDTVWTAELVDDADWGDFDYDGDGIAEEVNVGCESCHGPGSAHADAAGEARHIVSPSLLTPEREAMLCGQCHSRPKGALGTDSPVDADGWMMRAGTSRDDFLAEHATTQLDGAETDFYADDGRHSKSHHQQYSDFIRSSMYKNGSVLMTCGGCHDPHGVQNDRQLRVDPSDDAALCGGACHGTQAGDLVAHIDEKVGAGTLMAGAHCTDCHMPKTAKTGSGTPGAVIGGVQYWQNDVSSHLFAVPDKAWSDTTGLGMPTGYTSACAGGCHTSL